MVDSTGRIAVLRANGIGDLVFALPALDAIRAAHPSAEIVLLGLPWHVGFFDGRPGPVDRVEIVPKWPGVRDGEPDAAEQDAFFARMAEERFDVAVQMHGGGRNSNPFVLRLGAHRAVGLRSHDAPSLDAWIPYRYFQSEVQRCLEVASLVGARPLGAYPHLVVTPDDFGAAEAALPSDGAPIVVLNPGAGDGRRRWPTSSFAQVGQQARTAGARVVVTGDSGDTPLAEQIRASLPEAVDLTGKLTLGGLLGVFARSSVVVSNDSGPLHLAEAVGTRTVGIFWCGNVINAGAPTRTDHRVLMSWRLECPVCGANCMTAGCDHHVSFVAEVPADEVATETLDLLAQAPVVLRPEPELALSSSAV